MGCWWRDHQLFLSRPFPISWYKSNSVRTFSSSVPTRHHVRQNSRIHWSSSAIHPRRESGPSFFQVSLSLCSQLFSSLHVAQNHHRRVCSCLFCTVDVSLNVSPEFLQICKAVLVGFAVMGFIGYFVKLIHIPMCVTHFSTRHIRF